MHSARLVYRDRAYFALDQLNQVKPPEHMYTCKVKMCSLHVHCKDVYNAVQRCDCVHMEYCKAVYTCAVSMCTHAL